MRLTHKHKYRDDNKRYVFDMKDYRRACQKLGKLENIEDELGIDLLILFELFKTDTAYAYGNIGIHKVSISLIDMYNKRISLWNGVSHQEYPLGEYGRAFALTKGELK